MGVDRRGAALRGVLAPEREGEHGPVRTAIRASAGALGTAVLVVAAFGYWVLATSVYESGHETRECRLYGSHIHLGKWVLWGP